MCVDSALNTFKFYCKVCNEVEVVEEFDDIAKMKKICFSCHRKNLKAKDIKSVTVNKKKNKLKKEKKRYENLRAKRKLEELEKENQNEEDRY